MEFQCLALFFSLIVILMAAQAALSPEVYWERMLPNTPIPKVIREFPKLDGAKEISLQEELPFLYTYGIKKKELQDDVRETSSQNALPFYYVYYKKKELHDGVRQISSQDGFVSMDGVKKNQLKDDSKEIPSQDETPYDPQSKENVVLRGIGPVANHHHHDHSKPTLFFLEEGLRRGAKLDLYFPKTKYLTPLLPREITEHLPFSSEKINEILEILAVKPDSKNAENMEETLKNCEDPGMYGEEKHCATSLESMVDFVTSKLGKNVHVTSTEVEIESKSQKFIVKDGVKILAEEEIFACHPMDYPYVVFYCHKISNNTAHFMPLEGEDGSRVKAVAVCHKDTSEWDPNYIAFQVLKVKPGTSPVCHFFPDGHLLWYAAKES